MEQQQEKQAPPSLCSNGCGFYSNVATEGLCSKCYREQAKLQVMATAKPAPSAPAAEAPSVVAAAPVPAPPAAAAVQPEASSPAPAAPPAAEPSTSSLPAAATASPAPPAGKQPSPTRCFSCNKKVGLTGFSCKCQPDAVFCSTHRYAEAHDCAFDYRAAAKQQLEAKNPQVQASKLQRL